MVSTYTPNKSIEEPAYNDYAANPTGWTSPVNNNWSYLDLALGGSTSLNQTGLSGVQVLSTTQYRPLSLIVSGTPTGLVTYQIPAGVGGQWIIRNTSSSTVAFNSGAGGGTVAVGANSNVSISCDGTASGMVLTNYTAPSAAGSNTQVQYNSGGILAGSAGLTFDGTTLTATGLNANGNVTLGAGAGSTFTWNPNTVTLGAGAINIGSSTLYLNSGTQQVGIGTTVVGANKLTVAGTVASTAGGFVFPDATVQTTAFTPAGNTVLTQITETYTAPAITAGTLTINLANGTVFNVANNANITTFSITSAVAAKAAAFTLCLTANGTAYTQTWGASVKWPSGTAPTLTTTVGKIDVITFVTIDGGTTWLAFLGGQNF